MWYKQKKKNSNHSKHAGRSASYYSTFTYNGSLKIEKLLKIFFWCQIGRNQEAKAGECDIDSFCLAHLRGKFLARTWRCLGAILFVPFGRDSTRVAWEMSLPGNCLSLPSKSEGMPAFRHAVWQCVEGRRAAGNYFRLAKSRKRQQFFRQVIRSFQRGKWTKPSSDIFYFHAHSFCYIPHILKPNTFSESRCSAH